MPCEKTYCMRQVNPYVPNVYFGTPYERDENWYGCYLCDMGFGATYVNDGPIRPEPKPKLIKRQMSLSLLEGGD